MSDNKNILVISDAVSGGSGLARITRDLCTRIHEHLGDTYHLASAGYGSPGSSKFPWMQYHLEGVQSDWVLPSLPEIVSDFAGKERCTILCIGDAHRLTWLAAPRGCNELFTRFPGLQQWAMSRPFELFGYIPIDSSGPNDRLTFPIMKTLLGFDRLLAYGAFGEGVIRRTIGDEESDKRHLCHLPHGIDSEIFYELPRKLSRKLFLDYTGARNFFHMIRQVKDTAPIADDEVLIAIIATNQSRKNWALGLETCAILGKNHRIRVWLHTDSMERWWSLPNLLADYGLLDRAVISLGAITDERMATGYSAADISLGIGPEGYGFCIAESMACGTPCITGSYANNAALVDSGMAVDPVAFYYEGSYSSQRPVYRAEEWSARAEEWLGKRVTLNQQYEWGNNWSKWEEWFRSTSNVR